MKCAARTARQSELGDTLVTALQQALRERRLDVAEPLLRAIEIHGAERPTEAAYLLLARKLIAGSRREFELGQLHDRGLLPDGRRHVEVGDA